MNYTELVRLSGYAEVVLCVLALCFLILRREWRGYWALGTYLAVQAVSSSLLWLMARLAHNFAHRHTTYHVYFYTYSVTLALESILALVILFSVLHLTVAPLRGLQAIGSRVLPAIAIIWIAMALFSALSRHVHTSGITYMIDMIAQLQRVQTSLTLCLFFLVLVLMRAMRHSYGSTAFGVAMGLGILAGTNLALNIWLRGHSPDSNDVPETLAAAAMIAMLAVWTLYLALPQRGNLAPDLPAGSVLVRWNRNCLAWTEAR